jgi:hypothetical protein
MVRFFLTHVLLPLGLLAAFCHWLPQPAATLSFCLTGHPLFVFAVLGATAINRQKSLTWWRATIQQRGVGKKAVGQKQGGGA